MRVKGLQVTDLHFAAPAIGMPAAACMAWLTIVKIDLGTVFLVKSLVRKIMTTDANIMSKPDFGRCGCRADRSAKETHDDNRSETHTAHYEAPLFCAC